MMATRRFSSSSRLTTMPSGASVEGSYSMIMPLCPPSTAPSFMYHHFTGSRLEKSPSISPHGSFTRQPSSSLGVYALNHMSWS